MTNTKFIIKLAAILFAIAFVCTLILVVCNEITEPVIAKLQIQTENAAKTEVLPDADGGFEDVKSEGVIEAYRGKDKAGKTVGYCFKTAPSGFGGAITMMVGVNTVGEVTGVKITEMAETPGLGAKASDENWIKQFINKKGNLSVTKTGNPGESEINAISGATITSKAVTDGVNTAVKAAQQLMAKEGK